MLGVHPEDILFFSLEVLTRRLQRPLSLMLRHCIVIRVLVR